MDVRILFRARERKDVDGSSARASSPPLERPHPQRPRQVPRSPSKQQTKTTIPNGWWFQPTPTPHPRVRARRPGSHLLGRTSHRSA